MSAFKSIFGEWLTAYVRLRRRLGLKFDSQVFLLRRFDRYVYERGYEGALTRELAVDFATSNPRVKAGECARRYHVVRHFAGYLANFEPQTELLDPKAFPHSRLRPPARIFTKQELVRILHEARHISPSRPFRGTTLHAMIGLAASTGLRIGEVVRLDRTDVDLDTGVVFIRRSKFNKDRLVPVHATTLNILREYARARELKFHQNDCPAFFLQTRGGRFAKPTLTGSFVEVTQRAGLRESKRKGPGFHSLRHSFAVRRLTYWYEAGVDIQSLLPALATYMGHVHYTDTAYYLTATPELMTLAAQRCHQAMNLQEE